MRLDSIGLLASGSTPGLEAGGILVAVPYLDPESGARGVLLLRSTPVDVEALRPGAPLGPLISPIPCDACATLHGAVELCEAGTPEHGYRVRF